MGRSQRASLVTECHAPHSPRASHPPKDSQRELAQVPMKNPVMGPTGSDACRWGCGAARNRFDIEERGCALTTDLNDEEPEKREERRITAVKPPLGCEGVVRWEDCLVEKVGGVGWSAQQSCWEEDGGSGSMLPRREKGISGKCK